MTQYRRKLVPGGTYFFTVCLQDRSQTLLTDHVDQLRDSFRSVRDEMPFTIDAIVILPDHIHAIWTLPPDDADYSVRWRKIKGRFSRSVSDRKWRSKSKVRKRERGIWQRRFWEHLVRDEEDYARHVDYIHYNPVKHGHCVRAADWRYSSFHRYVACGDYPMDWGGDGGNSGLGRGE